MKSSKEQNIAVVKNAIEEFTKGNIQEVLDACAEDVVWATHRNPDVPFAKTYLGKLGAAQFFEDLGSNVDFSVFSPEKYYGDEDMVFVKTHEVATVKSTGKTYDHYLLMTFKIEDDKIAEFFAYGDSADQARAFAK